MVLCVEALGREVYGRRRQVLAVAGGVTAGFAFVMHQYGLISVVVGLVIATRFWRGRSDRRLGDSVWMVVGTIAAVLPWVAFVVTDLPEFRVQFGAAVANQAWRYPAEALARSLVNELPGRYVLDRQDYPIDWDPWGEVARLLLPSVSTSESLWPLRLVVRMARRPLELDPMVRARVWVLILSVVGLSVAAVQMVRHGGVRGTLFVVAGLAWVGALAVVPNKWLGYTVTPTVLLGLGVYVVAADWCAGRTWRRRCIFGAFALTLAMNGVSILEGWGRAPSLRQEMTVALHDAIPPGERVLIPFREWYVFVGRNPAISLEGRSLPMFGTSISESVDNFAAEYVVLVKSARGAEGAYYWVADDDGEVAEYLRTRTGLVRIIDGGRGDVFEVKRVVGDAIMVR
jgi:hypothetical protein